MARSDMEEIIRGYVDEVRTYLPLLTDGLASLRSRPDQPEAVEEMHRLVHTIKGASMMVGIPGLSKVALQMETTLSEILAGKLPFTGETHRVMAFTVDQFRGYCSELLGEGAPSRQRVRETAVAYRRLRDLPVEEDEKAVAALLEGVPEIEGGGFGEPDTEVEPEPEAPPPFIPPQKTPDPEPEASVRMSDIPEELLDSFYEEAKEHLEDLYRSLQTLETEITASVPITGNRKELVRQIRRYVHTLKGSAAVIGLSTVSAWGHAMEDFLDWLYEGAPRIDPEIIGVLTESGDLLATIIANPADPRTPAARRLRERYAEIIGETGAPVPEPEEASAPAAVSPDESGREAAESDIDLFSRQQTLRVEAERVDDLVNLIGELMITASGFEQEMHRLAGEIGELEIARKRIRELARDLEVGFEVKALGRSTSMPTAAAGSGSAAADFEEFDELELDRYSELNRIIRTLNESAIDAGAIHNRLCQLHGEFDGRFNRQRVILSELQDKMMQVRMLPLSTLNNKLHRTVREVSRMLGKKIRLSIFGDEIEFDRLVWEKITDPLMHLIRNAADHGIESPADREGAGKPATASLEISAAREGNQVVIRISDDGAGLDYPAIHRKAIRAGLLEAEEKVSPETLAAMIFKPGFSTRDTISEVSGRGVGMDVVRENIQSLKGTVRVASSPGKGTRFTIRIPLTLAAIRALLFTVRGRTFALSLHEIREILRVEPGNRIRQPRNAFRSGDSLIPLHSLASLLNLENRNQPPTEPDPAPIVLIVEVGHKQEALEIDTLLGQREIVIKSTGSHLRRVKGISGVTILGDGGVVPILNLPEIVGDGAWGDGTRGDAAGISTDAPGGGFEPAETAPRTREPLSILVVDDSASIRRVVSGLIESRGWKARTAKDGVDAFEKLREARPDVIVLDIEMPRMNGYEFLKALSETPEHRDIPVVMLTSRATGKHRDRALTLGAKGFAAKPFRDEEFIDLILKLAGQGGVTK